MIPIALLAISSIACTRVVDGPQGPQGPQGPPGFNGRDGNANVWSINYAALDSDWYDVGVSGEDGYFLALDLNVPEIDSDILNNGLVLVYYREQESSPWTALPYTFISHNPEYIEKLDFIYDLSFVGMQSQASDRQATPYAGTFRVIVAAGIPVGKAEIDWTDYELVQEYLDLENVVQTHRRVEKESQGAQR